MYPFLLLYDVLYLGYCEWGIIGAGGFKSKACNENGVGAYLFTGEVLLLTGEEGLEIYLPKKLPFKVPLNF